MWIAWLRELSGLDRKYSGIWWARYALPTLQNPLYKHFPPSSTFGVEEGAGEGGKQICMGKA